MAVLHAKGLLKQGEQFLGRSIIESRFMGKIEALCHVGDKAAIIPSISGRAWISGQTVLMCDPEDPWPNGYKLTDTWPRDIK